MSLRDCIQTALDNGEIPKGRAEEAMAIYDEMARNFRATHPAGAVDAEATIATVKQMRAKMIEDRRVKLLAVHALVARDADVRNFRGLNGAPNEGAGLVAILDRTAKGNAASNVEMRKRAIETEATEQLVDLLADHSRNVFAMTRNKPQLIEVVRAVFGERGGNPHARELGDSWNQVAEMLRQRFNRAGGNIAHLPNWGLPQHHDAVAVTKAGFQAWRDFLLEPATETLQRPRLDWHQMRDNRTGRNFTREGIEQALRDVYQTIATEGWNTVTPSGRQAGAQLAKRHSDHRFLKFADADAWQEYHDAFGRSGSAFDVMTGHIHGMARDIAMLELFGPNPRVTFEHLAQSIRKRAAMDDFQAGGGTRAATDRAVGQIDTARRMFDIQSGRDSIAANGPLANTVAATRNSLQAVQLGAAFLSSVSDLNSVRFAAAMNGLNQRRAIGRALKLLAPGSARDQRLAVSLGLIAESWTETAAAQARYMGEITGPEFSRRIADSVMRLSLLSRFTQTNKWAFGMEYLARLAEVAEDSFADLPGGMQDAFARYGLGAADWDVIRRTPIHHADGGRFLRPRDIAARTDIDGNAERLATRMRELLQSETELAVPSHSVRGRALLTGGTKPGTVVGEVARSMAMYKGFVTSQMYGPILQAWSKTNWKDRVAALSTYAFGMTLLGGLAIQLKEISKGRQPRDMITLEFWGAAVLQGGGIGILGDFLYAATSRFGGGLSTTIAGPVAGLAQDTLALTAGNAIEAVQGKDTNIGRETVAYFSRYNPTNLWWSRLAMERVVWDNLQRLADPEADKRFRTQLARLKKQTGQQYWWSPRRQLFRGEGPDQFPNPLAVVGDR